MSRAFPSAVAAIALTASSLVATAQVAAAAHDSSPASAAASVLPDRSLSIHGGPGLNLNSRNPGAEAWQRGLTAGGVSPRTPGAFAKPSLPGPAHMAAGQAIRGPVYGADTPRTAAQGTGRDARRGTVTWQASTAPAPPEPLNPEVTVGSVQCDSAQRCTAVGSFATTAAIYLPMFLTRSPSSGWSEKPTPLPANSDLTSAAAQNGYGGPAIFSMDCPAQGSCVAVGEYYTSKGQEMLLETESHGTWKASTMAPPKGAATPDPRAELDSVSCVAAGSCLAVGGYYDKHNKSYGMIATLAKGKWKISSPKLPKSTSGNKGFWLFEIDSAKPATYLALGAWYDKHDNGQALTYTDAHGKWTGATPLVKGGKDLTLGSAWCPSAGSCQIVSEYTTAKKTIQALVLTGFKTSWKSTNLKLPADADPKAADQIDSGSLSWGYLCVTAKNCDAIGSYLTSGQNIGSVIETEVAGRWTADEMPPSGTPEAQESVSSIGCWAADQCLAVGSSASTPFGADKIDVYQQNGSGWKSVSVAVPFGGLPPGQSSPAALYGVGCSSASFCALTGFYTDETGDTQGLLIEGSGTSWISNQAPHPANEGVPPDLLLEASSCSAAGACSIAGISGTDAVMETESVGAWTAKTAGVPNNVDIFGGFESMACPTAGHCVAVGFGGVLEGTQLKPVAILLQQSGANLTVEAAPLPSDAADPSAQYSELGSISCPAAGSCFAGGVYLNNQFNYAGFVLRQTQSGWTASSTPLPPNPSGLLQSEVNSIQCLSGSNCTAMGEYWHGDQGPAEGSILSWDGTSWHAQEAPLPAGAASAEQGQIAGLFNLACPAQGYCAADGVYLDSSLVPQALIVSETAGTWSATEVPVSGASLGPIACASTASCVAIGSFATQSSQGSFLESGAGTSWHNHAIPLPSNAESGLGGGPTTVACAPGGSCLIAGVYSDSNFDNLGFADTGSGSSWTSQETPLPSGVSTSQGVNISLNSATCPAQNACLIAGGYSTTGPVSGLILAQK